MYGRSPPASITPRVIGSSPSVKNESGISSPSPHALEDREVRRQEHPEVDRVLAVDALEALGHEEADARRALRVRRLLAGRALPAPPPGHRDGETPAPHRVLADRLHARSPSRHVRPRYAKPPERRVVVEAHPAGRDLVGRDVVAQLLGGVVRVPREILARELARRSPASSVR